MNFASLFSGCGGFDLGFIEEGFNSIAGYDFDKAACENFNYNIGSHIHNVDLKLGIPDGNTLYGIDVLVAGPPCQGFSTAGKRVVDDERNHLLTLTGELAVNINPKVLIVENVPGVLAGEHAKYWEKLNKIMRDAGYQTHTLRCQSSDLGIPQMRKRVLFFAWRTAHTNPVFDIPQNTHLSLKEVLHSLKGVPNHKPKRLIPNTKDWLIAKRIKPGQKLSNVRGGENSVPTWDIPEVFGNITQDERTILELVRKMRRQDRKRTNGDADPVSFQRLTSALGVPFINHVGQLLEKGYLRRIGEDVDLVGTFNGKYRRLNEHSPSCTVDTRFGSPRYFLHPTYDRGFTVREAARIQGFGDNYIFQGSEQTQYRVIGNAVPPVIGRFAAQVAKQLMST